MKKRILSVLLCVSMIASVLVGCGNSATTSSDTITVAAIETAYGSEMWQQVADAFTAQTGIKVNLITD